MPCLCGNPPAIPVHCGSKTEYAWQRCRHSPAALFQGLQQASPAMCRGSLHIRQPKRRLVAASAQYVAEIALIADETALVQNTAVLLAVAMLWSAMPLITGESRERNQQKVERRLRQVAQPRIHCLPDCCRVAGLLPGT